MTHVHRFADVARMSQFALTATIRRRRMSMMRGEAIPGGQMIGRD